MRTYSQALHQIWNDVLADDAVPASSVIMEAMTRAFTSGRPEGRSRNYCAVCDFPRDAAVHQPPAGNPDGPPWGHTFVPVTQ